MSITTTEWATCICAWCDRAYVDGEWRTPDVAPEPPFTHGICEECAGDMVPVTPRAGRRFAADRHL
jgi:hypothetical protein